MENFKYSYPTKVYFGKNAIEEAFKKEMPKYGTTVMIAYGGGSIKKNGIYDRVRELLENAGKNTVDFGGIMPNPTYEKVLDGVKAVKKNNVDFILAVGGGSVIDCCKVLSVQSVLKENIWELEYKKGKFPTGGLPLGAIVTVSGTGSEMNSGAVITFNDKKRKDAIFASFADFAILDPYYTITVPPLQVMSGAFDTLSHAMETYFGNSDENNVSDDIALGVMINTVENMKRLIENINDIQARSNLMWDSAMAENGILKCGRATDFQAHQIEHQLGAYTDCNHGQGLAVIQPTYYKHILNDNEYKFKKFANVVFNKNTGKEGIEALCEFIKECGLPSRLRELKTSVIITDELLKAVAESTNIIKTNPRTLSSDEIYEILTECF